MVHHGDDIFNYPDIRLNFSSNVYNHFNHTELFKHLADRMSCITNYPEPTAASLEHRLAERFGIKDDEVIVTNGATEAIYLIAQAYHHCRSHILQPTFGEYAEACRIHKHEITDVTPDVEWICNPNNPTGEVIPKELILDITSPQRKSPTVFVFDQSYGCFTDKPLLTVQEGINLKNNVIIHSMTKEFCVPGLRLGYVTGDATLLENLRRVRMPWSVNSLAIEAGNYLLDHEEDYQIDLNTLLSERQRIATALQSMGLEVTHSDSHILLCKLPSAETTAAMLKDRLALDYGILIRDASNFEGLSPYHFRIAVQTKEENDILLNSLAQFLRS